MSSLLQVLREEFAGLHLRLQLARMALAFLPVHVGSRLRVRILRLAGFRIGAQSVMWGNPVITGGRGLYRNLNIGEGCWINAGCLFDLGAPIRIGDRVAMGHEVMILTGSHQVGGPERRAAAFVAKPVTVGDGAWLGTRSLLLPGVNVGAGAVVASGAVVNRDVPPNGLVAGVPARLVRMLPADTAADQGVAIVSASSEQ